MGHVATRLDKSPNMYFLSPAFIGNWKRYFIVIVIFPSFIICSNSFGQNTIKIEDLGNHIGTILRTDFAGYDSLNLTIFVKFKIDSTASLDSVWVNGDEMGYVDYDKYIKETKAESLKILYSLYKKDYIIIKRIFELLKDPNLKVVTNSFYNGFYVLPMIADYRTSKPMYHLENQFGALKNFMKPGVKQYYFLEPIKFGKPCKDCL